MQFDPQIAKDIGVEEAIMYSNIEFWVEHNKANGRNEHDGYFWTYNSMSAYAELFPFWTLDQIRRILSKLEQNGYIKTGNYNEHQYDRTKWYTSIWGFPQMEMCEQPNGNVQTPKPIPDIKPDIKPDKFHNATTSVAEEYSFEKSLERFRQSDDKRFPVLAAYFEAKGYHFTNKEQHTAAVQRNIRASQLLIGYPIEQVENTMEHLNLNADFKWTLETVGKYIDESSVNKSHKQKNYDKAHADFQKALLA